MRRDDKGGRQHPYQGPRQHPYREGRKEQMLGSSFRQHPCRKAMGPSGKEQMSGPGFRHHPRREEHALGPKGASDKAGNILA